MSEEGNRSALASGTLALEMSETFTLKTKNIENTSIRNLTFYRWMPLNYFPWKHQLIYSIVFVFQCWKEHFQVFHKCLKNIW